MTPKNIKFLLITLLFPAITFLESCECMTGDQPASLETSFRVYFKLFEKGTGRNLLGIGGQYNKDSVQIYDAHKQLVYPGPIPIDGSVSFNPYQGTAKTIPIDTDTSEYFFLHLKKQSLDIDTIRISYRAQITDCSSKEFSKINLYFNDEPIFPENPSIIGVFVDIFKY